jgi:membrane-associated phospholipid phosphatase
MRHRAPQRLTHGWAVPIVMGGAAVTIAHLLDQSAWASWRDPQIYERDLGRLLRSMGYLPTWLIVAIGCWTADRPARGWGWRGGLLILSPLVGGAVAEALKLVVRRLRPDAQTFGYVFRPFADHPFSTGGLGMPSSHTLVAFAGATALARVFPRAWWLWYLLAIGCAITRVMATAHFLSDTVAAAALGWCVGELLSRWMLASRA